MVNSVTARAALIAALILTMTLTACGWRTVYHHYCHTSMTGWEKNDTLFFHVPPLSQNGYYDEDIGLRVTGEYPFQSLCLVVEQTIIPASKGKEKISTTLYDTLFCSLVNSKGSMIEGGTSLFQYNFPLATRYLNKGDSLLFRVRHNMKREIMPGIVDVGIRFSLR